MHVAQDPSSSFDLVPIRYNEPFIFAVREAGAILFGTGVCLSLSLVFVFVSKPFQEFHVEPATIATLVDPAAMVTSFRKVLYTHKRYTTGPCI
jgi:hypothetical protein